MKNIIKKISILIGLISPSKHAKRVKVWKLDKGDKTLRLNYPTLNKESVIFDVGGYEGQWASDIFAMYEPTIYIFEPVEGFHKAIQNRFIKNDKIFCQNYGLAAENRIEEFALLGDESSAFKKKTGLQKVALKDVCSVIDELKISNIDLLKINIEGGEYELINRLLNSGYINKVENIQVQFHDFVDAAEEKMKKIQKELTETHELTFQYEFVWENWKRKV